MFFQLLAAFVSWKSSSGNHLAQSGNVMATGGAICENGHA